MKLFSLSFFYICNEIVQKWDPCTLLACATDAFSSNPVFLLKFIAMGLKFLLFRGYFSQKQSLTSRRCPR